MFKKLIKLISWGIIMATLMSVLLGCEDIDNKTVEAITTQLSEKYDESFTVTSLGNRISNDTATAYVIADSDPTMRFTARIDKNGVLVFDDYAFRTVCRDAENRLTSIFTQQGMDSVCFCAYSPFNNEIAPGTSILDVISSKKPDDITVALVLRNQPNVTGETILQGLRTFHDKLGGLFIGVGVYVVESEDFDNVYSHVQLETQDFDAYRLSLYGVENPIREIILQVSQAGCTLSASEIDEILSKEGN